MSAVLGQILSAGAGGLVESVGKVIDDLTTSDKERMDAELEGRRIDNALLLGQQEINKAEAGNASLLVAGWRPFIGWICGIALGLIYIPQSVVKAGLWTYQAIVVVHAWSGSGTPPALPAYPDMGVSDLMTLLFALLGMAGLRHRETMAGTAREAPLTNPFKRGRANSSAAAPAEQEAP